MKILIAVCTYRRSEGIRACLESISFNIPKHDIVVVDNDPMGSAAEVIRDFPGVMYAIEPVMGIPAARNKSLEFINSTHDAVAFIDDDEVAGANWLDTLIGCMHTTGADVVAGPVLPVFPPDAPRWICRGGFFQRRRFETGVAVRWAASNNSLVSVESLELLNGELFSDEFSDTGGSDGELFFRLRKAGASIIWCDEALVYEDIPHSRLTMRWLFKRGMRLGNVSSRLMLIDHPVSLVLVLNGARTLFGLFGLLFRGVTRSKVDSSAFFHLTKGIGAISWVFGGVVREYKR